MDGYQFLASLFQSLTSLAWPIALVLSVWLFREKLNTLLPFLRMKYKDLDVSFRLDKAEEEAASLPPAVQGPTELAPTPEEEGRFEQLAAVSPRAAIQEIRRELEYAIWNLAISRGVVNSTHPSLLTAVRSLRNKGIISPQASALLDDLRAIGNRAAHGGDDAIFTKEEADRYRALARRAIKEVAAEAGS